MSITVEEIVRKQTSQKTSDGWKMRRVWLVTLEDLTWASYSAILAVNASPNGADIGDEHPVRPFCYLNNFPQPEATENRLIWHVVAEYEEIREERAENPLEEEPELSWGSVTYTEPVVADIENNDVVNSGGQPFDPPLTQERRALVATIGYNSESFNPAQAYFFQGAVNEAATTIGNLNVGARMARIMEIGATKEHWEDIEYWAVTIKVEINVNTWDRIVLDQGIYALDSNDNLIRMSTDDGEAVTEPLKLDGEGHKLDPQTLSPVFLTFRTYPEKDFSVLNLEV